MARKKPDPKRIGVIDCETDPFLFGRAPRPFIWGFTDGDTYRDFIDTDALIAYVKNFDGIVYAHNGGKFDFHFLLDHITIDTEILIINGRVAKAQLGKAELRDSYCILPIALGEYQKTAIDYGKMEANRRRFYMDEIRSYLKDDCNNLFEIVSQFIATYGMSITLASAALKFWKDLGHEVPESDATYYNQMSPWYAGGRVQCFRAGVFNQAMQMVDINSAYPFAMLHTHPYSVSFDRRRKPKLLPVKGASFYRIVAVSHGALFFRGPKGELTFPDDDTPREYHCTGWELQAGLDTKTVKVLECCERIDFHDKQHFAGYINHFYTLKKNSPKGSPAYIYAKLFMNSLYGKFAADPSSYKNYAVVSPAHVSRYTTGKRAHESIGRMTGPWRYAGKIGALSLLTNSRLVMSEDGIDQKTRSEYYNVATGASITGFVRAYLWKHICAVKKSGGVPLYCDTDSITFAWPARQGGKKVPFIFSKELGEWSLEGHFDFGAIAGKKLYALRERRKGRGKIEWKKACKGVDLDAKQIVRVARGEILKHRRDAPSMRIGVKGSTVSFIERTVRRTA